MLWLPTPGPLSTFIISGYSLPCNMKLLRMDLVLFYEAVEK
jgi:hypothetical protein